MSCWFPFKFIPGHEARRRKKQNVIIDSFSGEMTSPTYRQVNRDHCPLLRLAWENTKWMDLERRCSTHPEETFCVTSNSHRTALHLATFNVPCPLEVAQAMLTANRHMVVVEDRDCYTPLHNVCFFRQGDDLVALFCDTASMVQQELMGRGLPTPSGTSPLFLAAKRAAPLGTLQVLLESRRRVSWIAPSTGGEPYGDTTTLDQYSSPLEILLRGRTTSLFSNLETEPNKPLRKLLRATAVSHLARFHDVDITTTNYNCDDDSDEPTESISETTDFEAVSLWQKCILLLAEHCPLLVEDNDVETLSFGFLHAVACCKVPVPALLQSTLHIFPEQALQRDKKGNIPLHHVLAANHPYATKTLLAILLEHSPACSNVVLPNGQTPLVQALYQNLSSDILQELLEASEHAALQIPYNGLYPFAIAASQDYSLDVIYSFLTTSPQVLQN
jgi:ankyrin repeat protein